MLLLNKPKGITSHDLVKIVRKNTGERRVGHTGTLDPLAEGLMIILVGKGETKQSQKYLKLDKEYIATIRFGLQTDTGDMEGKVIKKSNCTVSKLDIEKILDKITGELKLPVPRYSAIKVEGEPLYKKARRGENFTPPIRNMVVYNVRLISTSKNEVKIQLSVASGVYIRSIVEYIGKLLNCPATMSALVRTKIGKFSLKDAQHINNMI